MAIIIGVVIAIAISLSSARIQTFNVDLNEVTYWKTEYEKNCHKDNVVPDEPSCEDAAVQLGKRYAGKLDSSNNPAGCFVIGSIFFNSRIDPSTTKPSGGTGICRSNIAKWSEETPDTYCKNNTFDGKAYDQVPCQNLCEANSGCIGFAWTQVARSACYLCQDDILSSAPNKFGFYRKPLGSGYENLEFSNSLKELNTQLLTSTRAPNLQPTENIQYRQGNTPGHQSSDCRDQYTWCYLSDCSVAYLKRDCRKTCNLC